MGEARVHYWIDETDCWQQLREDEVGWHAGDGGGGGNETTISIEIIMDGSGSPSDKAAEERGALLSATLLHRHWLGIEKLFTHTLSPDYISSKFKKILDASNLPTIRFHGLRHPYVKHRLKIYKGFYKKAALLLTAIFQMCLYDL